MTKETTHVLGRCREVLLGHYGVQLEQVVVYGSMAQDTADAQSDIDLLVLLRSPFEHATELRRIVDLLYPVQLETERMISAKPASSADFEGGTIQLYRNLRHWGLAI